MRKSFLPWLACAVIAVVVIPTLAWGAPTRDAERPAAAAFYTGDNFFRDAAGPAGDNEVTINPGDTVTFTSRLADPENSSVHNEDFQTGPQPSE